MRRYKLKKKLNARFGKETRDFNFEHLREKKRGREAETDTQTHMERQKTGRS